MIDRDVLTAKMAHVRRHVNRVRSCDYGSFDQFKKDLNSQDLALFNLQMAIQFSVDAATHMIADNDWRLPQGMKDAFNVLFEQKVISESTRDTMQAMVGFRNVVIHDYAEIDFKKVYDVLQNHLNDFSAYLKEISTFAKL